MPFYLSFLSLLFLVRIELASPTCEEQGCLYFTDTFQPSVSHLELLKFQYFKLQALGVSHPTAIAYDPVSRAIFVADKGIHLAQGKKLIRFKVRDSASKIIYFPLSTDPSSLAVDWISSNVYYTDAYNGLIGIHTENMEYHHLVVTEGTSRPRCLTFNRYSSIMYWVDFHTSKFQIRQANMDGTNMSTLFTFPYNSRKPIGLTYVTKDSRLYWCRGSSLESMASDGTDDRHIYSMGSKLCIGMTADDTHVYWIQTDQKGETRINGMAISTAGGQRVQQIKQLHTGHRTGISAMTLTSNNFTSASACSGSKRGGCEHICIPKHLSQRVCRCAHGFVLQPDGMSCQQLETETGLLVVDSNRNDLLVLDLYYNVTHILNVTGLKGRVHTHLAPRAVAYDSRRRLVFWADEKRHAIFRACYPTKPDCRSLSIYKSTSAESNISDISLDKEKELVYVVDKGAQQIFKIPYEPQTADMIRLRILYHWDQFSGLAFDRKERNLYWTVTASSHRIERVSVDIVDPLTNYKTFIELEKAPSKLAVDSEGGRLYWTYEKQGKLESADLLDNSDRQTVMYHRSDRMSALTIAYGCVFWAYSSNSDIYAARLNNTGTKFTYIGAGLRQIADIAYFSIGDMEVGCDGIGTSNPSHTEDSTFLNAAVYAVAGLAGIIVLTAMIVVLVRRRRRRRHKRPCTPVVHYTSADTNGSTDHHFHFNSYNEDGLRTPTDPDGPRPPALLPQEAMRHRPLPVPPPKDDHAADAPAEAGFRQFLLRNMSHSAPEYDDLAAEEAREQSAGPLYSHATQPSPFRGTIKAPGHES